MLNLIKQNKPLLKVSSGLCIDFAAASIFLAAASPGFIPPKAPSELVSLTLYITFGIVFIIIAYLCEREMK